MAAVEDPLVAKFYLWEHECWLEQDIGVLHFDGNTVRLLHVTKGDPMLVFTVEADQQSYLLPHMFTESAWIFTTLDQTRSPPAQVKVALVFQTAVEYQRFRTLFERAKKMKRSVAS